MIPTLWIDAASSLTSPALALGLSCDGATESTATIRTAVSSTSNHLLALAGPSGSPPGPGFPGPGPDGQPVVSMRLRAPPPFLAPPPKGLDPRGLKAPGGMAQPGRRPVRCQGRPQAVPSGTRG